MSELIVDILCFRLIASYSASLGYDATAFKKKLMDSEMDWSARVEWKYGCTSTFALANLPAVECN